MGYKIEVKGTQSNTGKTFCSIFVAKANTEYGAQCIVEDAFDFSDAENLRFNVCAASEADMAFCRQRDVAQIS